jgi:tetratricopeptide (TPR) repeat protein
LIGRRLGRFRILSRIGQGGLATVWRAHDELLGRDVALKILNDSIAQSPKVRKRFVHEAQAASSLEHPGIVTVFDAGESDGLAFMALTLIEGETVSDLAARRLVPIDEAVRVVTAAADALAHAHARGVIHRDVSGRNVMVANDGRVFVLDFGLALAVGLSRVTTSPGTTLGTIAYMAPEALHGTGIDVRADVYGLGVVLFEALTGAYPHPGDRTDQLAFAKLNTPCRKPSELRPEVAPQLDHIVEHALARDPADRYATMAEMLADLRVYGRGAGVPGPDEAPKVAPFLRRIPIPSPLLEAQETLPDPAYLAILPFKAVGDSGSGGAEVFLASRLADAIGAALGAVSRIRIVPISAGDASRWEAESERAWAEGMGANLVLSGQVARSGARLRVTYSLRDPWRSIQLAGGVTDGSEGHAFDLEDAAVVAIRKALGETGQGFSTPSPRPVDAAAADKYQLALRYLTRHDHEASVDGAIRLLETIASTEPALPEHVAALGRAYLTKWRLTQERGWEARAASACERALTRDPGHPQVLLLHAEVDEAGGRADSARAGFEATLTLQPDLVDARLGLVRLLMQEQRWDEAESECSAIIRAAPSDWRAFNRLGGVRFRRGNYSGCVEPYRRVVELIPGSARGHMNMGSALYHLDQFDAAIEAYEKAIAIEPDPIALSNLGTALFHQGRYPEAVSVLERAVAMRPAEADLWGNLGNACRWIPERQARMQEALERAVALMKDRLDSHPYDADGRARMAGWMMNLGQREAALAEIQAAIRTAPDDIRCLARAGYVYADAGDHASAVRWFRSAVQRGYGTRELERSPVLAQMRAEPEFQRVLEEGRSTGVPGDSDGRDAVDDRRPQ